MKNGEVCVKTKLCPCSLGVAFGVVKGLSLVVLALSGAYFGYGTEMIQHVGSTMYGYAPTFVGSLWGGVWGFVCGFVFGLVFGFIYNYCLCYGKKFCSSDN